MKYWPTEEKTKDYGIIKVELLNECQSIEFTLREFEISLLDESILNENDQINLPRKIYQYHFTK